MRIIVDEVPQEKEGCTFRMSIGYCKITGEKCDYTNDGCAGAIEMDEYLYQNGYITKK